MINLSLTDDQLVEGILGALGWVLFFYYFRNRASYSIRTEGFLAWTFVWWLRKFGMNMYAKHKKTNKIKSKVYRIL